ncbi:hypothetical protein [Nocardia brasiliensis]|uniref:hypothetical protein n=1 Tax=Nocardia brasiliensis TaxID=37326 RepID=UPI003D8C5C20
MTTLTREEIRRQRQRGLIRIEPFRRATTQSPVNDWASTTTSVLDARVDNPIIEIAIPAEGFVLTAGPVVSGGDRGSARRRGGDRKWC